MRIKPLRGDLIKYLARRNLTKRWEKQKYLFEQNPKHPSLETELLEPKHLKLYSFRITQKYRAIFVYPGNDQVEIIDINNHYK
ncbi:MAG: hypothetical protein HY395_01665 [Candidatus Doudnabacteria bacterium]|nr:hypothetical protein [Candidatus Doudnabacteria bacterium]